MKLAEAAQVLGITLEDVTLHSLRDTYSNLTMSFDPEKCKDPLAKQKYIQVSEAYKKLHSVMDGKDTFRGEDQHEIAAFMRMFMDMVGISESDSLPTAAMTLGMMFGAQQNNVDEWSTDEDPDADYDDDEEEDEDDDYLPDEYYDDMSASANAGIDKSLWEPQVKHYSHMNLKDQVSRAREGGDPKADEAKKLRLAKKRADKRKKQKEKKQSTSKSDSQGDESSQKLDVHEVIPPESLDRIVAHHKQRLVEELLSSIEEGRVDSAGRILSFNFHGEMPSSILEPVVAAVRGELPNHHLLHLCITDFSKLPVNTPTDILDKAKVLQSKRIEIAAKLLRLTNPVLDLHLSDDSGLSMLHKSVNCGDLGFAALIMDAIANPASERKTSLNLNSRCHKKGWAPIHYAVEKLNVEAIKLLSQKGANLQATSATDKRLTPVELAKTKAKAANLSNATKELIQRCIQELTEQIALQKKLQKESQKSSATPSTSTKVESASSSSKGAVSAPAEASKAVATVGVVEDSKSDKKKKKPDAKSKTEVAPVPEVKPVVTPVAAAPSSSTASTAPVVVPTKKQSNRNSKAANQKNVPVIIPAHEMSVASRDEMVDRLLAMGFKEADCLAAIALYGTDIDQAISWLVDKPTRAPVPEMKGKGSKDDQGKSKSAESSSPAAKSSSSNSSKSPEAESALSLQQKREELRRINREWNAKTEDEKRKLEQQKKLVEETKQKEVVQKELTTPVKASKADDTPSKSNKQAKTGSHGKNKHAQKEHDAHSVNRVLAWRNHPNNKNSNAAAFSGGNPAAGYVNPAFAGGYGYPPAPPGQDLYYGNNSNNSGMGYNNMPNTGYPYDANASKGYDYNNAYDANNNAFDQSAEEVYINGALELSAVAKPFVPKTFTPVTPSNPVTSSSTPTMDQSSSMPPVAPLSSGLSAFSSILPSVDSLSHGNSNTSFLQGLGGSTNSLTGLEGGSVLGVGSNLWSTSGVGLGSGMGTSGSSLDPFSSLGNQSSFLSNILGKDLGLDVNDSFEFDAGHDLIPDIDSLLGNLPDFK